MWCISAHEYVFGEVKMTKIFAAYLQTSGFQSQSLEYALECCREQLGRYGISLLYTSPDVDLVAFFVLVLSSSCWCRFPSGVLCTQLLSPVLEVKSVLLEFALSWKLSRSRWMWWRMGYYSLHFSFSCFTTCMWPVVEYPLLNPACCRGWFSLSVFSSLFVSTFDS